MTPIPDLYHLAFEGTDIGLVLYNAERRCVVANAASATLLGSEAASLPGSAMETLLGPQSPGMPEWELRREHPDGGVVWLLCRISPPLVGSGHFVVTLLDISERKRYVEELQHCATRDPVSGLPGRTPFCERLAQAIAYAVRNRQPLAVLLLDIDQFQRISAEFGNTASDSLRRTLAERLHTAVRQEDTLAALGTDQYALLLQPTSSESVAAAAQRLLELLAAPVRVGELEFVLSACVGVALHPEDGDSAEDLLDRATEAMLEAKRQGPGHIQFITAEINVKAKRRLAIGRCLGDALGKDELRLEYQPLVSIGSDQVVSVEALLRWHSPTLGEVPPGDFLPLAENSGAITAIDDWVLTTACRQARAWQDEGLPEVRMAVNLSGSSFRHAQLVQRIGHILSASGMAAEWLQLEITERVLMANPEASARILAGLKAHGVRLAMDDFGTDFSSLAFLSHMPLDCLKIGRSFINDITTVPVSATMIKVAIAMAQMLGMKVVAEGVETSAQLLFLAEKRCDFMQGNYFSPPAPAMEIGRLLIERRCLEIAPETEGEVHTLLLVDDEANILNALKRVLRREGYRVLTAHSAAEGLEQLALHKVQVIVTDQRMPAMSGIEFLGRVRELYPDTVRMVLSGYTDLQTVTEAINHGAVYRFLTKPWEDEPLREHIRVAFHHYDVQRESK